MTDLRDELERIADHAPAVMLSPDLYARARRAHVRSRLLTVSAVAACLTLLVGVLAIRPWHTGAPRPANGYPAPAVVPDRIYVPTDDSDLPLDGFVTPNPMSAPVVAAYVLDGLTPSAVLIHGDGSYGRVTLPGLATGMQTGNTGAFALSPDGRHLAYYSRGPKHLTSITVVDFGDFTSDGSGFSGGYGNGSTSVGDKLGALVSSMHWSDDSRWLVWDGQPIKHWHENGASYESRDIAGRMRASGGSEMLPSVRGGWSEAGICDDGTVVAVNAQGSWSWSGGAVQKTGPGVAGVLATGCQNGSTTPVLSGDVSNVDGGPKSVLGWSADGLPVVTAGALDANTNVTAWDVSILGSHLRPVAVADPRATRLTLATGLMSSTHPTSSLPRPPWASEPVTRWIWVGGGLGAATAVGVLAYVLLRRGRRPKLSP